MSGSFIVREYRSSDEAAVHELYPLTFPDEDLLPLVRQLLNRNEAALNLVSEQDGFVIGHVGFSRCSIEGTSQPVSLLAPLAVHPDFQRTGVGSALINDGFTRLEKDGHTAVLVLGDPNYYSRFGFSPERNIEPPYRLPDEWSDAWQSHAFPAHDGSLAGTLIVPEFWQDEALWLP